MGDRGARRCPDRRRCGRAGASVGRIEAPDALWLHQELSSRNGQKLYHLAPFGRPQRTADRGVVALTRWHRADFASDMGAIRRADRSLGSGRRLARRSDRRRHRELSGRALAAPRCVARRAMEGMEQRPDMGSRIHTPPRYDLRRTGGACAVFAVRGEMICRVSSRAAPPPTHSPPGANRDREPAGSVRRSLLLHQPNERFADQGLLRPRGQASVRTTDQQSMRGTRSRGESRALGSSGDGDVGGAEGLRGSSFGKDGRGRAPGSCPLDRVRRDRDIRAVPKASYRLLLRLLSSVGTQLTACSGTRKRRQ